MRKSRPRPVHPVVPVLSWEEIPVVCTCADGARALQCTPEKVQRMASAGEIPAFRIGPEWRFRKEDLLHFIRSLIAQETNTVEGETA